VTIKNYNYIKITSNNYNEYIGKIIRYSSYRYSNNLNTLPKNSLRKGTLTGIVPKNVRKDKNNIIIVCADSMNVRRVKHAYFFPSENYNDEEGIIDNEDVIKNLPKHRKVEKIECYKASDHQLFEQIDDGRKHQLKLDFNEWSETRLQGRYNFSTEELFNFLVDNKKDLLNFIRRIKL